eukprot:20660-Heterococcus_DN1.PRE.2
MSSTSGSTSLFIYLSLLATSCQTVEHSLLDRRPVTPKPAVLAPAPMLVVLRDALCRSHSARLSQSWHRVI